MKIQADVISSIDIPKPKSALGLRHVQALMLCLALAISYAMRVNMSMAIVAMTDKDNENTFDWSMQTQSVILSSFFWGYVLLQIPSGELAARFGGNILITLSIGINSIITLLIPLCANSGGWKLVCACRVAQGLAQGFLFPSIHNLIGKWVPLEEKSQLGTFIYAGSQIGTALQYISSGYIAEYWGWPAIFYVVGYLGAIWTAVYVFLGFGSPSNSRMISNEERLYIQTSLGQACEIKKLKTPWKSIWTSLPFISLIVVHCGQNWGHWTLNTEMPSYMKLILGVDIKKNGVLSALPYLATYALSFPLGFMADYVQKKKWLSTTASRKSFNSFAHYGGALALIGLSFSPAGNVTVAVLILIVVVGVNAGHYMGFMLVHIDMAPNFAGTMMGITNCLANIISIIAPLAAGALLQDESDPRDWQKVFFVAAAIYIACNTFFLVFGTSEKQQWNDVPEMEGKLTEEKSQNNEERAI